MDDFLFMTRHAGGSIDLIDINPEHPGFQDIEYRERRNAIAKLALEYRSGEAIPLAEYTEEEHGVWRLILEALSPLHRSYACREILELQQFLGFSSDRMPQLSDVNETLKRLAGFRMEPVAGLVSSRMFMLYLGRKIFLSTQYIRHYSQPFYTPEPDIVHEFIGHAATLAHPGIAEINRLIGVAVQIATDREVARLASAYWYTLEFGAVMQDGEVKAFGAGLLSSVKEIQSFRNATLRDWDLDVIGQTPFDPTDCQEHYFVAPSFTHLITDLSCWLRMGGWREK
ncbi:MAG: phenylalanine 4-monooxygenase [Myxococcota bacterium]|nr:phenylalanine 4-monooxygenase [Myxococcota bacterium]